MAGTEVTSTHVTALRITIGLALLVVLGSFLPWATVTASSIGTVSFNGMNGDGALTLILGALIAVICAMAHSRRRAGRGQTWLVALSALAIAVVGIYDLLNVSSIADQTESGVTTASVGVGLYMVVAGGVGLVATGIWIMRTRPEPPPVDDEES